MIAESGLFALILALVVALAQGVVPLLAARHDRDTALLFAMRAAYVQAALLALAFAALILAFARSDFSLMLVAANSHSAKPLLFKIAGSWGNHEGSMLLWGLILALSGAGFARIDRSAPALRLPTLAVMGGLGFCFLTYLLFASSPFDRLDPVPIDGDGLNPLLQDIGLVFHPPMLYLGYVGMALPFALAMAALMQGRMDGEWARAARPWIVLDWTFLTLGIGIGAWWSYYTLGWGGFWAWDPVENAALLPWLAATALLHAVMVVAKRDSLKPWTLLIAIIGFALSLMGTFLVRSGAVVSVHAFAADPTRGVFILALFAVIVGFALLLFALRAASLSRDAPIAPISREGAMGFNIAVLALAAAAILVGTLYPVALDALAGAKVTVDASYYNRILAVLAVPLLAAMAIGPLLSWRRGEGREALRRLRFAALAAAMAGVGFAVLTGAIGAAPLLFAMAVLLGISVLGARHGWAMRLAHGGMAVMIAGIAGYAALQSEALAWMRPGEHMAIAGQSLRLDAIKEVRGTNYTALRGEFSALKAGQVTDRLHPEIRLFDAPRLARAEVAIHTNLFADLYLAIAAGDDDGGVQVRALYLPLVPLVFIGLALMVVGGFVALWRPRATDAPGAVVAEDTRRRLLWLPLIGLGAILLPLAVKLGRSEMTPQSLLNTLAPDLVLPALDPAKPSIRLTAFGGQVVVVNLFASWCAPCRLEAPVLMGLAQTGVPIVGIATRDRPEDARAMLHALGNPFVAAAFDAQGDAGTALGATGVPETVIIDRQGVIRWRHEGPLDEKILSKTVLPLIRSLR